MKEPIEYKEFRENPPKPRGLDVIKINNRWAQSNGGGLIRYLNDNSEELLGDEEWQEYQFVPADENNFLVGLLEKNGEITNQEISNVIWGWESAKNLHLQRQVRVFGEYKK